VGLEREKLLHSAPGLSKIDNEDISINGSMDV
jgi:hypothetical protein